MINSVFIPAAICFLIALSCWSGVTLLGVELRKRNILFTEKVKNAFLRQFKGAAAELKALFSIKGPRGSGQIKRELSAGTSYVRNRLVSSEGQAVTADAMLEELASESHTLKYAYSRMLALLRTDRRDQALEEFSNLCGSRQAREYASLILMLDRMPADILYDNLTAFQKTMNGERVTQLKRRDELLSDILYIPVVVNLLLIFFNFLYVTYFMQQKDMLTLF